MSNEMPDEPPNEMREIQKRIEEIVDKMNAMIIAGVPREEQIRAMKEGAEQLEEGRIEAEAADAEAERDG
jgi:hypothetical protein